MVKQEKTISVEEVTPEDPYQWFSIIYPTNKKGRQEIEALLLINCQQGLLQCVLM